MKLPKIDYYKEMDEILLMFTFDTYPSVLSIINCNKAIVKSEAFKDRSQILLSFKAPLDSIEIDIKYLNDKGIIIKKLEKIAFSPS